MSTTGPTRTPAQIASDLEEIAATAAHAEQLEAAFRDALAAMDVFATAVERVQQLRSQHPWPNDGNLVGLPRRPEPLHVRAARNDELGRLTERFRRAARSAW